MAAGWPVVRSRTHALPPSCPCPRSHAPLSLRPVSTESPRRRSLAALWCTQVHLFECELRLERKQWFGRRLGAFGRLFCRQWCSRAVGNLCGGAGATWQERSRLPGWACQCQQGAAHGNVRAAATLSAAFARPRVAAFASPRPCAARRCQKTLIALVPAGRSSLRPRCVELARVRPGASMRACPGDIFGTFMARGACVPLFQRPSNASAERPGKCEFFVFNRTRGLAGMGGVV